MNMRSLGMKFVQSALLLLTAATLPAWAQSTRPDVQYATRTDTSQPLRRLQVIPPPPDVLGEIFERPFKQLPNRAGSSGTDGPDPVLQIPCCNRLVVVSRRRPRLETSRASATSVACCPRIPRARSDRITTSRW